MVLSFDGAIIGFFIIYGIPIFIHLKCYHHKYTSEENLYRRSLLSSADNAINEMELDDELSMEILKCNDHAQKSKTRHYAIYGLIMLFGVSLGAFKIYSFVHG